MLEMIGMIIVAIIGLIGVIIQTQAKTKQKTIEEKLDALRKESKDGDKLVLDKLDSTKLDILKIWLTVELTKVRDELYKPNEEQKRLIIEAKRKYNDLGGDSYVDDMYDECKLKKLI